MTYCLQCFASNNPDSTKFCQTYGGQLLLQERYRAVKSIGQGGFGRTFQAIDEAMPRKPICVIKQFAPQGPGDIQKALALFEDEAGTSIGSAEYIAPEQARGKAVLASDLYSLGVTCIHLLTGISPFELMDLDGAWVWRNYVRDNSVSEQLGQVLDKLIVPSVSQRYQSVIEVLRDLDEKTSSANSLGLAMPAIPNAARREVRPGGYLLAGHGNSTLI